jgi:TldD protein
MKGQLLSLLRLAQGEYADIRYEITTTTYLHWVGKELESVVLSQEEGGALRVKSERGWSFISFNDIDKTRPLVPALSKQAVRAQGPPVTLAKVPSVEAIINGSVGKDPRRVTLEEKHRLCSSYNRILLQGSHIQTSDLKYQDTHTRRFFLNSEGSYIEQERFYTVLGMASIARNGVLIQSAHEGVGGVGGFELVENQQDKAERTAKRATDLLGAEPMTGGQYTVVIDPELSGVFAHEAFGHLSEADFLFENERLMDIMSLGREFGTPALSIIDDPTIPGEGGYYRYDDEGVLASKTFLIREGKLVGRLHSRETAGRMNETPTGNARALNYEYPPIVRMSNTYIESGTSSTEEIIAGVQNGVYARGFRGGQTNLEMFTFSPEEGHIIENGKLTRHVRDFNLSGNVFTTLSQIDAIGRDLVLFTGPGGCGKDAQSPLPVSTGGPHIRIRKLIVGGH